MLLELLEDKHFGRLDHQTVFKLANNDAKFANLWLVHSMRSDCPFVELALAVAANIKWNTAALNTLEHYLNSGFYSTKEASSELTEAIAYSKEIISDFCEVRHEALLFSLQAFLDAPAKATPVDATKYTCNIPFCAEQADNILTTFAPLLKDVSLFGGEGKQSKNKNIRNNTHFPTPLPNDSMQLALLENLLTKAANLPISFAEPPVVLRYQPGQYYHWHYDFIYPHTEDIKQHIAQFGQRIKTAIFYLNDGFTGGETEFKEPFISISPKRNKALFFDNCDEFEQRDITSIHRGTPIESGEKWIITLWFRNKPFWLRSGLL